MTKLDDLTNLRFNRLLVIERDEDYIQSNGRHRVRWKCLCDCGNTKSILVDNLKRGLTESCGCLHSEISSSIIEDLTGKTFGRLFVLERGKDVFTRGGNKKISWKCVCECGTNLFVTSGELRSGDTKSCGCLNREKVSERLLIDLTGKTFGKLKVLKRADDSISPKGIKNAMWLCKCECGNEVISYGSSLRKGNSVSCGCLNQSFVSLELKNYFIKNYGAISEYKIFKNPETNHYLPFDIYIPHGENPDLNGFYIEVHGEQHYKFIQYWHKKEEEFEYQKHKDRIKRKFARKHGTYIEIDLRKIKTTEESIEYIGKIIEKILC